MILTIDENTRLELTALQHAEGLYAAVHGSRAHLSQYLPWVDNIKSVDNFVAYVMQCEKLYLEKNEVSFVIMHHEVIVGRIGLHHINLVNRHASIGYWLTKDMEGKGIILRSCKVLIQFGFYDLGLNRLEIRTAVDNLRSQAIPEKLNFKKEGIARQAEWLKDGFVDLVVYSLLKEDA